LAYAPLYYANCFYSGTLPTLPRRWNNQASCSPIRREADSLISKGAVRIIILVERESRHARLCRVVDWKTTVARNTLIAALHPVSCCMHTLTYRNGSEFAEHALTDIALQAMACFAELHSP